MAGPLRLRQVQHTDGPLETRLSQGFCHFSMQGQNETLQMSPVQDLLNAARQRRPYPLALHRPVPFRSSGYCPPIGRETDQHAITGIALARQLTHIMLTPSAHIRGAASPRCELCAQTAIRAECPRRLERWTCKLSSVSLIWLSRRFQVLMRLLNICR